MKGVMRESHSTNVDGKEEASATEIDDILTGACFLERDDVTFK